MSGIPFVGQRTKMSRKEAVERYILVRWRAEQINHLGFLVEGLYAGDIQLPSNAPFTHTALKDTARTAFFGWFATLTDRSDKAVYAFDPLLFLYPNRQYQIGLVQKQCEALAMCFNDSEITSRFTAARLLMPTSTLVEL